MRRERRLTRVMDSSSPAAADRRPARSSRRLLKPAPRLRSLGQKHRLRDLADDAADLRRERDDLSLRMRGLQDALRREADADASGALASHLRRIFAAHPAPAAAAAEDQ